MAKDKGNKQGKALVEATVENVQEVIRNGNLIERSMTEEVRDKIKQEADENKAKQLKKRILEANFRRLLKLLQLRHKRVINEITLNSVKQSEILEDRLGGFKLTEEKLKKHGGKDGVLEIDVLQADGTKKKETFKFKEGEEPVWVPGDITCAEFDRMKAELAADEKKKVKEADDLLDKNVKELQDQYPGYFCYLWMW